MTDHTQKQKGTAVRLYLIGICFLIWLAVIGARAGYLQLYRGAWLSQQAAVQYEKETTLQGKRGTIYDTRHQAMAVSIETTSLAAYPAMIEDKDRAAGSLALILGQKRGELRDKLKSGKSFVWLKRQATPKESAAVKKLNMKGLDFLTEHSRFYPNTSLAAQVLGFTGLDGHGLEGLEFFYDRELKGGEYTVTMLKDALGRGFDAERWIGPEQAGNNLVLTIDSHVQLMAEQALAEAVNTHKARSGMAVLMDPQTGAVLALAQYPFFNPNNYAQYDRTAYRNRVLTDPFEPGSTMKIFDAAAALESRSGTPETIFFCENGRYPIGPHVVNDTKPHGWLSLTQIVKYSSNIGAVKVMQKIGPEVLYDQLREFGFGQRTLIDCPGESIGNLPNYKQWTSVDAGAIAFGQGLSTTAMQLMAAASALANDGVMMQPYLVQAITAPNGKPLRTFQPKALRQVISADTAREVRRMMRSVVLPGGTGVEADLEGYEVCGKTGTAQKAGPDGKYAKERYVSSFIGIVPTERPALVALVVVDEPKEIHYGGFVAAPAFRQIIKTAVSYLNIPPVDGLQKLRVSRENGVKG
jgi:cell division protein FtsI (penicillin-binding protein 3)